MGIFSSLCMIQDGQKIVLDSFTNFKFMMGEKTRFSKLMKWIKDTQDDVHFIHKGTVLSKNHPTSPQCSELVFPCMDSKLVLFGLTLDCQVCKSVKMGLGAEYKIS